MLKGWIMDYVDSFKCPRCLEYCNEDEVEYSYVSLNDGFYRTINKDSVFYGMGQIISELELVEAFDNDIDEHFTETFVNGICPECHNEIANKQYSINIVLKEC